MDVKLTILSDDKQYFSQTVSLPCVVGRGRQSGVAILHPVVSRQHCEIYEEDGRVFLRDLGSLNGTFFQGKQVGRGVEIPFGAEFSIGRLYFRIDKPESFTEEEEPSVFGGSDVSRTSEEIRREMDRRVDVVLESIDGSEGAPAEEQNEEPVEEEDPFAISDDKLDDDLSSRDGIDLDDLADE